MKVLVIRSNPVAPDPRVEKEASALGKAGYEVTVLSWDRENKNLKNEKRNYYNIHRFKLKAPYGHPFLLFKLILWWIYEIIYLIKNDFDALHACDLDTLIVALPIARLKSKFIVYDSFDFYADCLPLIVPSIIRIIITRLEIFLAKLTDFVILVDESRLIQFKNELNNTVIIYNSPPEYIDEHEQNKTCFTYQNKDFIIFYAGILDENRGFEQIIRAVESIDKVKLIIAGYGTNEKILVKLFEGKQNIRYLGKLQYREVIELTTESDLLFALYNPLIPNYRYSSPNKLFEAMMCGKPIIVSDDTSMASIVKNEECGIVVPYENVDAIKVAINKLKNDPNLRKELGENGRNAYQTKYSWKIMEKRLLSAYIALN